MAQTIRYSDYFTDTGFDDGDNPVMEYKGPTQAIRGELVPFYCAITSVTPVTGDKWRFLKVPKGAKLYAYSETTTGTSTACPGTLGWETADVDAFMTDIDWEDEDTTTVAESVLIPAIVTTSDDYLTATIGTVNTGGATTVKIKGAWFIP